MTLTLADADRIVDGAIAEARKRDLKISVAICDADGRLVALKRMDGVFAEANRGSIGKAVAAASLGRPSDAVGTSIGTAVRTATVIGEGVPVYNSRGGLPILHNGEIEGGCGIEGTGSGEQDEECARAGLERLHRMPES